MVAKIIPFPKVEREEPATDLQAAKEDLASMNGFTLEMAEAVQWVCDLMLVEGRKNIKNREEHWNVIYYYEECEDE